VSLEQEGEEVYDVVRYKVDLLDWSWLANFWEVHVITHWVLMNDNCQRNSGNVWISRRSSFARSGGGKIADKGV